MEEKMISKAFSNQQNGEEREKMIRTNNRRSIESQPLKDEKIKAK